MEEGKRWHTREDSGIRLDQYLRWWHDDAPVEHPKVIEAFNRGLSIEPDGRYKLTFGNDWCFVEVADAAFAAVALDVTADGQLSIRLSDRTAELLDVSSLRLADDEVVTARVKDGRAKARFSRDAQFALLDLMQTDDQGSTLLVAGRRIPLPDGFSA